MMTTSKVVVVIILRCQRQASEYVSKSREDICLWHSGSLQQTVVRWIMLIATKIALASITSPSTHKNYFVILTNPWIMYINSCKPTQPTSACKNATTNSSGIPAACSVLVMLLLYCAIIVADRSCYIILTRCSIDFFSAVMTVSLHW